LEQVIPMVATHTLRLPISPPDYIITKCKIHQQLTSSTQTK